MIDTISMTELELAMRKVAQTAKLDTIEACAKICDRWIASKNLHERLAATHMAQAIRALSFPSQVSKAVENAGD